MRTLGLVLLTLMAGATVQAQTVKSADLVGRWVEVGDTTGANTELHADSTFITTLVFPHPPGKTPPGLLVSDGMRKIIGSWRLIGDTLLRIPQKGIEHTPVGWEDLGPPPTSALRRWRVAFDGKRLKMMALKLNGQSTDYERDGSPAGARSSLPELVRPQTLQPADLVGRWIVPGDTITFVEFRADMAYITAFPIPKKAVDVPSRFQSLLNNGDTLVPLRVTGLWRVAGDTLTIAVQNAALWIGSAWHDMPPPHPEDGGLQRVRREGKRLFLMPLKPTREAHVLERDDRPAMPATAPIPIDSAQPKP